MTINHPIPAAELIPLRALDAALRAYADVVPNPFNVPANSPAERAISEVRQSFTAEARRLFGDKADALLGLVMNSDDDLDKCISRTLGRRTGRVLLWTSTDGEDIKIVAVLDGPNAVNDAHDWVNEDDPCGGRRSAVSCDIFPADAPATPDVHVIPARLAADGNLDMLAADLAKTISNNGYADKGFDVGDDAIEAVLADFIVGALAAQARLDAQRQD